MVILTCPNCGNEDVTVHRAEEGYTSFECGECGEMWIIDIFPYEYKED